MAVAAVVSMVGLAWAGFRVYPLDEFFGVDGLRKSVSSPKEQTLVTVGALGWVRHSWYLAGLLLLWTRDLNAPALVASVVLSGYLVIGAMLEERRLGRRFGSLYADYCARVPMLVPWRWLLAKLKYIFYR